MEVIHRASHRSLPPVCPFDGYSVFVETIKDFFAQKPSRTLYHYTNARAAIGIIEHKEIWASNIRHLNDASEFVKARTWVEEEIQERIKRNVARYALGGDCGTNRPPEIAPGSMGHTLYAVSQMYSPVFVASFSESENLLSQWRAYCPQGDGYSLGFDASSFENSLTNLQLVKCIYKEADAKRLCREMVDGWKQSEQADLEEAVLRLHKMMALMAAIKDESFAEEREWRLVALHTPGVTKFRPGRHGIVPFRTCSFGNPGELQLKRAWIGPNSDTQAALHALMHLVASSGLNPLDILQSQIPFRG